MFYDKKETEIADVKLVIMIDGSCTSSGVIIGTLLFYIDRRFERPFYVPRIYKNDNCIIGIPQILL